MKLEIELKNPKYCIDCPCFFNYKCNYYNKINKKATFRLDIPLGVKFNNPEIPRPKACIEENGE